MSAINLVCSTDDNWAPYAAAVILSARDSSPPDEDFVFHVLTFGLSSANIEKFEQLSLQIGIEIKIHLVDSELVSNFPETPLTRNAYLRIFIGEILPDFKKALYRDCDTLVLRPLRPLYELDVSGFAGAACLDRIHVYKSSMKPYYRAIGMKDTSLYFNSGVMLINLDDWRRLNIPAQMSAWFAAYPNVGRFGDQDPLNVVLEGRLRDLSPRWNMTSSLMEGILYKGRVGRNFHDDMKHAAIIHFSGGRKPWHPDYTGPFAGQFLHYLGLTPWAPEALPSQTLAIRLVRTGAYARQFARRLRSILKGRFIRTTAYRDVAPYDV